MYRHFPISVGAGVLILVVGRHFGPLVTTGPCCLHPLRVLSARASALASANFLRPSELGAFVMTTSDQLSEEKSNARFGLGLLWV